MRIRQSFLIVKQNFLIFLFILSSAFSYTPVFGAFSAGKDARGFSPGGEWAGPSHQRCSRHEPGRAGDGERDYLGWADWRSPRLVWQHVRRRVFQGTRKTTTCSCNVLSPKNQWNVCFRYGTILASSLTFTQHHPTWRSTSDSTSTSAVGRSPRSWRRPQNASSPLETSSTEREPPWVTNKNSFIISHFHLFRSQGNTRLSRVYSRY